MRIGPDPGRIHESYYSTGGLSQAGKNIHILSSSLSVQRVKLTKCLQTGQFRIHKTIPNPIKVDLDIPVSIIAGGFDDLP